MRTAIRILLRINHYKKFCGIGYQVGEVMEGNVESEKNGDWNGKK
jgi:hypothetical protein